MYSSSLNSSLSSSLNSSLSSSLNDNRDTNIFANISFSFDEELVRRKIANQKSKMIPIRQREKKEILSSSPQISDALQIMSQVSVSPSLFDAHYLQE